jgi:uncharacterized protein YggL (DUF469 family)
VRKRLRKKLRVGEFQELGFTVELTLPPDLDEAAMWLLSDAFLEQAIEANGLLCGGGCGRSWDVFVVHAGRCSATEAHRAAVAAWLAQQPLLLAARIGPLVDAWHIAEAVGGGDVNVAGPIL